MTKEHYINQLRKLIDKAEDYEVLSFITESIALLSTDEYAKKIRKCMKDNKTYDKVFEIYIMQAASILTIIDELQKSLSEHGAVIENATREGNTVKKKNPALDDLSKMYQQFNVYMMQLGLTPKSSMGIQDDDPVEVLEKKVKSITYDEE